MGGKEGGRKMGRKGRRKGEVKVEERVKGGGERKEDSLPCKLADRTCPGLTHTVLVIDV